MQIDTLTTAEIQFIIQSLANRVGAPLLSFLSAQGNLDSTKLTHVVNKNLIGS